MIGVYWWLVINLGIFLFSRYGKGFGLFSKESPFNLPNPVFGIFFYVTQLFVAMFCGRDGRLINFFIIQAIVSNFMSVYLGYILFFVLNDVCVVCVATYVVNALMLQAGISRRRQAMALEDKEKSSNKPDWSQIYMYTFIQIEM